MKNKPNHHSIVAKENSMVEHLAKFKLNELRMIAYCLAHFDSSKPENRTFYATVSDLTELFPINKKEAYGVVKAVMKGINEKPLEFEQDGKKYFWNWFSGFAYTIGTGEFEFRITPEIRPYLLGLEGSFTRYRLGSVYQFKSAHTWKLYENLKKEAFKDTPWTPSIDELKILMGVAGKYKRWNGFNEFVIAPAIAEINKKSDLEVRYDKRKRGRSVVGLIFQIIEKPPADTVNVETSKQIMARLMAIEGVNEKTIGNYIKKAEKRDKVARCVEQIPKIVARWNTGKGPKIKYLLGAIQMEINQRTIEPKAKTTGHTDFSAYNDKDLRIFLTIPGYREDVRAEMRRRGLPE